MKINCASFLAAALTVGSAANANVLCENLDKTVKIQTFQLSDETIGYEPVKVASILKLAGSKKLFTGSQKKHPDRVGNTDIFTLVDADGEAIDFKTTTNLVYNRCTRVSCDPIIKIVGTLEVSGANPQSHVYIKKYFRNKRAMALLFLLIFFLIVLIFAIFDTEPILFLSRESKTAENGPVFNRISFTPGWDKDVWLMQQSLHGNDSDFTNWERIAIVVRHNERSSEFFQLIPGGREFDDQEVIPKKVKCFACHSNGPRAIRPDFAAADVGSWNRLRVFLWNLRIKFYGPVGAERQNHQPDFRLQIGIANDTLKVEACTVCHNESSWFGRGHLTRQNFPMINFMLEERLMPPLGFNLSLDDRERVFKFIGKSL